MQSESGKYLLILITIFLNVQLRAQDYQKELGDLYNSRNFDEVIIKAKEYLKSDSTNPGLNLVIGRALVDKGFFNEGLLYLQKIVENNKNKNWMRAWAMNYLGRVQFLLGDKLKSKQYLVDCINLNATKNVTRQSKLMLINFGFDDFYSNFEIIESKHFTFYFQPQTIVNNKIEFIDLREKAYLENNNFFEVSIPKKIDFFIWNENLDAVQLGLKELGFAIPEFCVIHSRANQTHGHEITHVITHYLANDQIKTRFINEGIAVCFDLSNNNRLEIINKQKAKDSIQVKVSINEAWANPKTYPKWVYYPLAGEFVFRIFDRWGKDKIIHLIKNQTYENALLIYGEELNTIISELKNEIN
jgi:hypothetical protein